MAMGMPAPPMGGIGPGYGYAPPGAAACDGGACSAGEACCAVGGASCGGGIAGYTMAYTGVGDYYASTTYKYAGPGAGTFSIIPIPGQGCSCWWSLCLLWLLLPLLFLPDSTTTTTTMPPPVISTTGGAPDLPTTTTLGPPGTCRIYGDPHILQFDGGHASFYSGGEYWIVKSATVWIQGRYLPTPVTNGLSVTKELAIGGPFLKSKDGKENILRVSALAAMWNGEQIIPNFPDEWKNKDPAVEVVTDGNGEVLQQGRQGKPLHVVHITLPLGVGLQVNRWNEPGEGDYINVQLTMPAQPLQDGHCGNFNGDPSDDTRPQVRARVGTTGVEPESLLFNTKTPVKAPNRPDLNDCPTEKSLQAKQTCAQRDPRGMASHECMVDVCFGGPQFADEDAGNF